jgi:hypothetical protein
MSFHENKAREDSGRGGFLLCSRDPATVFQGEFNRLAAFATTAQSAHIQNKLKKRTTTKLSTSKALATPRVRTRARTTGATTTAKKFPSSQHSDLNFAFHTRQLSNAPEDRATWLGWHSGLDAFTVFPRSPVQIQPSLKMKDYIEHEDPEDAGSYLTTTVNDVAEVRSSPPMSHSSEAAKKQASFAFGRKVSNLGEGYGRTGWAFAHPNNQIKDGLAFVGDTAVSLKQSKPDQRMEHSHAKDIGAIEEIPPLSTSTSSLTKQAEFAFNRKVSNLGEGYGRTGWAFAHPNNQIKDGLAFVGDTAVSLKQSKPDQRMEHSHAKDIGGVDAACDSR